MNRASSLSVCAEHLDIWPVNVRLHTQAVGCAKAVNKNVFIVLYGEILELLEEEVQKKKKLIRAKK